ncbi:hypothetical protein LTR37_016880 [Vermiconidia calcicola]|uniref:Uncharacterized protein n=1 Tax=Vermiconidia calcicola TaxID=1690605 RepID=A0ACC3MLT7_9PEZI|nr:hypothetical protein LTR37_016880 [Vermiconidia calcicola]
MCRWFAYISPTEPCLLEDVLVEPKHSLARQVHEHYLPRLLAHDHTITEEQDMHARNMLYNIDGLGIAWYTSARSDFERGNTGEGSDGSKREGLRPAMYKTVQPPMNDSNFRSICANTETRVLFGHIRAASSTTITAVNNHPFIFGRHSFMHNGVLSDFTPIRRAMTAKMSDAAYANVFGSTDSEHLAALYITYLTDSADGDSFENSYPLEKMVASMHKAVATSISLQRSVIGDKKRKPNSLNLCATDGVKLVAFRCRNHATSQPPSLYYSTKAGTTLNRKHPDHPDGHYIAGVTDAVEEPERRHGAHLIVASEPSTYKAEDWELLGKNQCITAEADGEYEIMDIPYEKEWDAEDHV